MAKRAVSSTAIHDISEAEWKDEMESRASHFHVVGMWVAIIFNPIFGITDYLNMPESWLSVFVFRLGVSLCCLVALYLNRKRIINTYLMVAIAFGLVSVQNAYTYSLIGPEQLLGHHLNYLALFMGAAMFIIWPYKYSLIAIFLSIIATVFFMGQNSALALEGIMVEGGLLLGTGCIFMLLLINARYRLRRSEIKSRLALDKSLQTTAKQKEEIEQKNKLLTSQTQELIAARERIEGMNARLQEQNGQLEHQVAMRTERLTKSNREMNQLVYSLSHDFRTPVVNLRGLLQLSEIGAGKVDQVEIIEHMGRSVNHLDELLRNMKNFSVYWEDTEIKSETVDMSALLRQVWKGFQHLHKNEMTLNLGAETPEPWLVNSDTDKVRTILYCIIGNAIRYRKEGQAGELKVEVDKNENQLKVRLMDDGMGIKKEQLGKVFNMFYRADERSMGAGLGLYICKGIIDQLKGEIDISSQEGVGTAVLVKIPVR